MLYVLDIGVILNKKNQTTSQHLWDMIYSQIEPLEPLLFTDLCQLPFHQKVTIEMIIKAEAWIDETTETIALLPTSFTIDKLYVDFTWTPDDECGWVIKSSLNRISRNFMDEIDISLLYNDIIGFLKQYEEKRFGRLTEWKKNTSRWTKYIIGDEEVC